MTELMKEVAHTSIKYLKSKLQIEIWTVLNVVLYTIYFNPFKISHSLIQSFSNTIAPTIRKDLLVCINHIMDNLLTIWELLAVIFLILLVIIMLLDKYKIDLVKYTWLSDGRSNSIAPVNGLYKIANLFTFTATKFWTLWFLVNILFKFKKFPTNLPFVTVYVNPNTLVTSISFNVSTLLFWTNLVIVLVKIVQSIFYQSYKSKNGWAKSFDNITRELDYESILKLPYSKNKSSEEITYYLMKYKTLINDKQIFIVAQAVTTKYFPDGVHKIDPDKLTYNVLGYYYSISEAHLHFKLITDNPTAFATIDDFE
ncbi:MAG: hypothetical protein LBT37_06050 [Lactobacillaceae bacterium]|jgi:hypothetical protein|nr:hypothetical protein [Lactobacillaceae bacterium]